MATDPFDSLRVRLANHVTRRNSLTILGLLGMVNAALLDEADAKKKRRKKNRRNNKNGKGTTTSTTTLAPGTCGAAGSNCGTAQTSCICGASPENLENVRCVSFEDLSLVECESDAGCPSGKICILDPNSQIFATCVLPCEL